MGFGIWIQSLHTDEGRNPETKFNIMKKKIQQHVAVEELYRDSDGWWVVLKDGYNYFGCCAIRQDTLTSLYGSLSQIKIGNPY